MSIPFLIILDLIYPIAPVSIQHHINRYLTRTWIQLTLRVQEFNSTTTTTTN